MQEIEIKVRGEMDRGWSGCFGGLNITRTARGETVLAGFVRDQAELRGMIYRLADLGLDLISVGTSPQVEGVSHNSPDEEVVCK
jgi:hypothetical protein